MPAPKDIARSVLAIVGGDKATASRGVRSDTAVDTGIREAVAVL